MQSIPWITALVFFADLMIRVGLSVRVVMRRRPVGVSLAWLSIVLLIPFFGAVIYLFLGELRLGNRRALRAAKIHEPYQLWLKELSSRAHVDWSQLGAECEPLARLAERTIGIPTLSGNAVQLIDQWEKVFDQILADIDAAKRTCHMVFYIWHPGGRADEVTDALIRASQRGVICRVLVDDVGSHEFLRSSQAAQMREAGVGLQSALRAGLIRMLFTRFDLRMHRKIVVIDGEIAYTGSLNLVDPRYFKQDSGVGQWIDAMIRIEGPAVEPLAITFLEDWELEANEGLDRLRETGDARALDEQGDVAIQVLPSGPASDLPIIQDVLIMAIYAARRELVMTTPYFVPDETLLTALMSAAQRGVEVILIVPAKVDSMLVRLASQAFKGDLLAAGVHVMLFDGGLLHTKSISVDGEFSLFGSLNLDPRSLHLNFEITAAMYNATFTAELRALQESYLSRSKPMDPATWEARSPVTRFTENAARLAGPLL